MNVRAKTVGLEESITELHDLGLDDYFLHVTPKDQATKEKNK